MVVVVGAARGQVATVHRRADGSSTRCSWCVIVTISLPVFLSQAVTFTTRVLCNVSGVVGARASLPYKTTEGVRAKLKQPRDNQ